MSAYRIVLADDHVLVRQGLKTILERVAGLEVVGEANDGLELLTLLKGLAPDLVILDISMPRLRGIEAIHEIRALHPQLKVLMLTMHRDREYFFETRAAGASGYILKEDMDKELFSAIERIRQGRIYVSPKLSEELVETWAQAGRHDPTSVPLTDLLTIREREVLKLSAEGKSSKEIADLLYISHRTVERHRANLMVKLNARKTVDVVRFALKEGYV